MLDLLKDNIRNCEDGVLVRKKRLLEYVISSNGIVNKAFIIRFLLDNTLDRYIEMLSDDNIKINIDSFVKKGYFTSDEQFICILDNFITYFFGIIGDINIGERLFKVCINSNVWNIFLDKKYFHDNDNMEYFYYHFNLVIIDSFCYNLKLLKNDLIYELDSLSLNMDKFDIKKKSDVKMITVLLGDLCFINKSNDYMLFSLFNRLNRKSDISLSHFEILFSNYFNNIKFLGEYNELIINVI